MAVLSLWARDNTYGQMPNQRVASYPLSKTSQPKLESSLAEAVSLLHSSGEPSALTAANQAGTTIVAGGVRVIVQAQPGQVDEARRHVVSAGASAEQDYNDLLQVLVPIRDLERLVNHPSIRFVKPADEGQSLAVTEGSNVIGAATWQLTGVDGSGVKVAIIDGGFVSGYGSKLGTELPASVTTANFRADSNFATTDHGTAVAEIVHDVASWCTTVPNCGGYRCQLGQCCELLGCKRDQSRESFAWLSCLGYRRRHRANERCRYLRYQRRNHLGECIRESRREALGWHLVGSRRQQLSQLLWQRRDADHRALRGRSGAI